MKYIFRDRPAETVPTEEIRDYLRQKGITHVDLIGLNATKRLVTISEASRMELLLRLDDSFSEAVLTVPEPQAKGASA